MRRIPAPPFEDHLTPEIMFLLAGSVITTSIFLPRALKDSVIGWIGSVIGISGVIALFIISILSERGSRYSFESFRPSIFLFFVMLGITAGLFIGSIHKSLLLGITGSLLGFIAGYSLGIFAGVWINYLGWMKGFLVVISLLVIVGMVVDLVFLFGLIF